MARSKARCRLLLAIIAILASSHGCGTIKKAKSGLLIVTNPSAAITYQPSNHKTCLLYDYCICAAYGFQKFYSCELQTVSNNVTQRTVQQLMRTAMTLN